MHIAAECSREMEVHPWQTWWRITCPLASLDAGKQAARNISKPHWPHVFVQFAKCICSNCKLNLSKLPIEEHANAWHVNKVRMMKHAFAFHWKFKLLFRHASVSSTYPSKMSVILLNFHSISVAGCSTWKVEESRPQLFWLCCIFCVLFC